MRISIAQGSTCSLPEGGCTVALYPNNIGKLISTNKYLLISGSANVVRNDLVGTINSPYTAINTWQEYNDVWTYDVDLIISMHKDTEFIQIVNPDPEMKVSVYNLSDSNVSFNATAQSKVVVLANSNSYTINGEPGRSLPDGNSAYFMTYHVDKDTQYEIQTSGLCKIIHIKK